MLADRFVNVALIDVVCGLPGDFEKSNVIFRELLSNATMDGNSGPLAPVIRSKNQHLSKCRLPLQFSIK